METLKHLTCQHSHVVVVVVVVAVVVVVVTVVVGMHATVVVENQRNVGNMVKC